MNTLMDFASSARSSGFKDSVADPEAYLILLVSRKFATTEDFRAKFTFSGRSPLASAILMAFSFEVTTPTRFPLRSSSGPPLLPAWTGADICR